MALQYCTPSLENMPQSPSSQDGWVALDDVMRTVPRHKVFLPETLVEVLQHHNTKKRGAPRFQAAAASAALPGAL